MSRNTITVGQLIDHLSGHDHSLPVNFGGLNFYRCKDRGAEVHIEFNETVYLDNEGYVIVINHDLPPRP